MAKLDIPKKTIKKKLLLCILYHNKRPRYNYKYYYKKRINCLFKTESQNFLDPGLRKP